MDVSPSSRSEEKRKLKEEIMMEIKRFQQKKLREEVIKELISEGQIPLQDRDEILKNLGIPLPLPEIVPVDHKTESANLQTLPFQRCSEVNTSAIVKPVFNLCNNAQVKAPSVIPPGANNGIQHKLESVVETDDGRLEPVKDWKCDLCKVKLRSEYQLTDHRNGQKHKKRIQSMEAAKDTAALSQPLPALKEKLVAEETVKLDQQVSNRAEILENLAVSSAINNYFVGFDMRTSPLTPHQIELKTENPLDSNCEEPVCLIKPCDAVSGTKRKMESLTETEEEPNLWFRNAKEKLMECDICKIQLTDENSLQRHFKGKKRQSKCAKAFSQLPPRQKSGLITDEVVNFQELGVDWKCQVCNVRVVGRRNIKGHIEGRRHTLKASKVTQTLSQPPPDEQGVPGVEIRVADEAEELLCKMCNFVGATKEEMIGHKSGNAHLMLFLAKDECSSTDIILL